MQAPSAIYNQFRPGLSLRDDFAGLYAKIRAPTVESVPMRRIAGVYPGSGDLVHRNMVPLIHKKHDLEEDFSEEGREELGIYHQKVCKQIGLLEQAFAEIDLDKAKEIMDKERKYLDLEGQYKARHLQRLMTENKNTNETHEVHTELMDLMKQVIVYTSNIAKTFFSARSSLF